MTKSVLISINTSWNIYNFRSALIHALKASGYRIISAAPDDAYTPRLTTLVDQHIALPMHNDGTSVLRDFMLFLRYIHVLRQVRPSVILTYTIKPNIYGAFAARVFDIPIIVNVSGLGTAFIKGGWLTHIVKQLYRLAFRSVACVFFQNTEDRDLFIQLKLVAPDKVRLLAGSGVNLTYFNPTYNVPREMGTSTSFVLVARLLRDKGIGEYVAAARIVKASHPETVFRLVGPRGVRNQTAIDDATLNAWVAEGVIDYLGETDRVRDILARHDCVALPSYREGMSRILLEAAAMGKPLIATDVAGCRQVVDHERNGFLCKPADAQDLASMMVRFIESSAEQRAQMGAASRLKAEREFDETHVIAAYLTTIATLTSS